MSEWQPIETAPKDGAIHLRWSQEYGFMCVSEPAGYYPGIWDKSKDGNYCGGAVVGADKATHWMPLPEPPK